MLYIQQNPDRKVHGANMGPIWGRDDTGEPHDGAMNYAIWAEFILSNGLGVFDDLPSYRGTELNIYQSVFISVIHCVLYKSLEFVNISNYYWVEWYLS